MKRRFLPFLVPIGAKLRAALQGTPWPMSESGVTPFLGPCAMPPSVVLDTNVFVAAGFNPRSASAKIVDAVKQGRLRMLWNDATRREIELIMQKIPPLRGQTVAELFRPADRFTGATHPERFADIPDPADREFAALAHAAGASVISNDKHLLRYHGPMDLTVLTPATFWKRQQRSRPIWR